MSLVLAIRDNHNNDTLGYIRVGEGKYFKSQDEKTWEECTWLETLMLVHDEAIRRLIK